MSNYLALRSSAAPTVTVSTLLAKSINFQSTTLSLGQSTNQTYNNFSGGSFTTGWASTLTGTTAIKKVILSNNGATQTILQSSGSTMSTVITSANSGLTWAGSTMMGLPTGGALAYQTYASTINASPVPTITAMNAAASGTNQLAIVSNNTVYASANSGATFSPQGLGQNNNPFIYIPFDGSTTDVVGNSVVTATGSPAYVTGKVGSNAVNINNSATVGLVPSQYLTGTWTGGSNFTISFWFNSQSVPNTGQYQALFAAYQAAVFIGLGTGGQIYANMPSGGGGSAITLAGTSFSISQNTWYNVVYVFQTNGLCSFYVNNTLIASVTNTGGTGTTTSSAYTIGAQNNTLAFNGYIDDFRLYNYAVTNPSGAALMNPIVGPIMPFVYLPFDGSTTTDVMGNSTTTATGSPGFVAGQVGSNAINFANTAGGMATRYITGPWTGSTNFTISLWLNYQTAPLSTTQVAMSFRSSGNPLFDIGHNTSSGFVQFYYGASNVQFMSLGTLSINTWYRITFVYQQGGTSSAYLNEQLITSVANSPTIYLSPTTFELGSRLTGNLAFNGYIDDVRIYNGAFTPSQLNPVIYSPSYAVGSPNIYLPFENGSVLDVMGYSAVSARGTMNFVPGVVGSTALNLVNPAGSTAVNFLRGSWAGAANFTVSFWFNGLSPTPNAAQIIFSAYNGSYIIYLDGSNRLNCIMPSGGGTATVNMGFQSAILSTNTWNYAYAVFQTGGSCSLYINNTLLGNITNSSGYGTLTATQFSLGTYDNSANSAFNGYIDDFKLYNCAVPFSALGPMNYTQAAINNTGAYQVVATANGGVYESTNSGSSWSQAAATSVVSAVNTVGGQVITPQLTGLAANTWTQNGVAWTSSASSNTSVLYAYGAFNNYVGSSGTYSWGSNLGYSASSPFACTSGVSTTILGGVGAIVGEWLQLQTSVPLVMQSYSYTCGGYLNIPQKYYIVGSNDGSTWYPIQYASMTTNPFTANFQVASTYIIVNQSGTQTITGGQTGSGSFTTYTTTTTAYTYFRILATNLFREGTLFEFGELYINFATPPTPLYVAPSTALIANQSLNAITVMPQQTGLVSSTWTTNGISWVASSSTALTSYAYNAFNSIMGSNGFYTGNFYNGNTGAYTGSLSTTVSGVSPVSGEWLQIQSSAPLVMSSYTFACTGWWQLAKTGYIVGSTDGTTWYPIQSFTLTTNPFTANYQTASNYITIGPSGTQTQTIYGNQAGSGSFTGYATSSNTYTYFRFIASTIWGASGNTNASNNDGFAPSEWLVNFTAYTPALVNALTMSPTGQYMALTGAGATTPNLTGLATSSWTANGVSWAASSSSNLGASFVAYYAFNGTSANTGLNFASASAYNTANGAYTGSNSTTVVGITPAVTGEWLQIQSSVPLVLTSYTYGSANWLGLPKTGYWVGSNDGTTWYPLQSWSMTTNPLNSAWATCSTYVTMNNYTGTQTIIGNVTGSGTFTPYSYTTQAYQYFRMIGQTIYAGNVYYEMSELYLNFQSGPTFYSTDYGLSWTRALSAATVPNANMLATSGNGQYSLQGYGQTVVVVNNTFAGYSTGTYTTPTFSPALSSSVGAVNCASISATGQYMVVLIQSTTNNVYYSTNYGISFTGLTVGSSSMMSCAMSADGTYITVANQTQVYTLNWNTQGYAVTIGSQSGLINQGQNVIAIGNQAGVTNQSAGSIILNTSGSAVNAYFPGFFVSPVASSGSSVSGSFAVLGYGSDSQVVQSSSLFIGANGYVGIGTANTNALLQFSNTLTNRKIVLWEDVNNDHQYYGFGINPNTLRYQVAATASNHVFYAATSSTTSNELMRIAGNGYVGIGNSNPVYPLSVQGHIQALNTTNDVMGLFSPSYGNFIHIGAWNAQGSTSKNIALNYFGGNVGIGKTNPNYTLEVNGNTYTNGLTTAASYGFANYAAFPNASGISFAWNKSGGNGETNFMNCGGLGTGGFSFYNCNSGSQTLSLIATISASGTYTASDETLKTNIVPIKTSKSLARILALQPVTYQWIHEPRVGNMIGFIAQSAQTVNPHCVTEVTYSSDSTEQVEDPLRPGVMMDKPVKKLAINYQDIILHLVGAIQEHERTIVTQGNAIAALEARLTAAGL